MARTKVTKRKKGDHSAANMLRAIKLHRQGMSVRKAAKECDVYYPTLFRYIKKHANVSDSNLPNQRLTPYYDVNKIFSEEQEAALSEYIKDCALKFYGLSIKSVRSVAYQMAKINKVKCPASWEKEKMAGLEWVRSFRSRHPDISLKKPEACSLARATAFNKETVKSFFTNLKDVMARHPAFGNGCRVYNLDETATTTVQKPQKVMAPRGRQNIGQITSGEKGTLVTTCAIVCAAGHALPPVLVFPRKNYKSHMLIGAPPGSLGLAAPTGWMNTELFIQVMQHFIKHTSASVENPALLIMDNHESHLSIEALDLAKQSGVTILTLHPHTTAKMQPLDVGLNGPFKVYYNSAVDSWLLRNPGKPMTIYSVAACVGEAYVKAMTPSNILSAFKKCGIFPYDENVFTEIDFLPSAVTDRDQPGPSSELYAATVPEELENENPGSPSSDVTYVESPVPDDESSFQNMPSISEMRDSGSPTLLNECDEHTLEEIIAQVSESETQNIENSSQEANKRSPIRVNTPPVEDIPESSRTKTKFMSPKDFMPPLKAGPRTGQRKPRKLGKSMIATDTPEKDFIAEERKKTQERKSSAKTVKRPVFTKKKSATKKRPALSNEKGKKKSKKALKQSDSETSEEEDVILSLSESDLSADDDDGDIDLPLISENFEKMKRKPKTDDYVLVLFDTKKKNVYYIARITDVTSSSTYDVSFMRLKSKDHMKFIMPLEPDLSEVNIKDIKMILPSPKITGTIKRNSTYIFPVRVSPKITLR